jgi:Tfp pilus assembly protein PilN
MFQTVTNFPTILGGRTGLASRAGDAFKWWVDELWAALPRQAVDLLERVRRPEVSLFIAADGYHFTTAVKGRVETSQTILDPAASAAMRALPSRLHPDLVFLVTLSFPFAAECNLGRILDHHIGLILPLDPKDACFDFKIVGRDPLRQVLTVEIAIIKKETLTQVLSLCETLRVRPSSVRFSDSDDKEACFDFLPSDATMAVVKDRRHRMALNVLAIALIVTTVIVVKWQTYEANSRLETLMESLHRQSEVLGKLEQELSAKTAQAAYLQRRLNAPSTLAAMNEITNRLPYSCWLTDMQIAGNQVTMAGNANDATVLIGSLSQSPLLEAPRFQSPIETWRDGTEHFQIILRLRDKP